MAQERFNCPYCEQVLKFDEYDKTYQCPHCGYLGTIEQLSFAEKAINQKFFDERKIEMHAVINEIHQCEFEQARHRIHNCLKSPKYQDDASHFLFSLYLFLVDITGDFDFLTNQLKVFDITRLQSYTQYESYTDLVNLTNDPKKEKTVKMLIDSIKKYLSEYAEYKENYKERDVYFLCDNREAADEIFNKALIGSEHPSFTDYCDGSLSDAKAMFFLSSSSLMIVYIQDPKNTPYADYVLGEYDLMTSFKAGTKKQRRQVLLLPSSIYKLNHLKDIIKEDMVLKERSAEKVDELRSIINTIFDANFSTVEEENRKFSQYEAQIAPMVNKDYLDDEEHKKLDSIVDNYIEALKTFKIRFNEAPQAGYTDDKLRGLKKQFSETKQETIDDLNRWKEKYIKLVERCSYFLNERALNDEGHKRNIEDTEWCKEHKDKIEEILGPDGMVKLFGKTKYADIQTVYNLKDGYDNRLKELKIKVEDILSLEEKLKTAINNCEKPYFDAEKLQGMVRMYKQKRESYGKNNDFNNWVSEERKLHYYRIEVLERNVDEAIKNSDNAKYRNILERAEPSLNTIKNYERDILAIINNRGLNQGDFNRVNNLFETFKTSIKRFRDDFPELKDKNFYFLSKHEIRNADDFSYFEKEINRISNQIQKEIDEKNLQKKKQEQEFLAKAKANVEDISRLEKEIIGFIKKPTSSDYNANHVNNMFNTYCKKIDNFKSFFSRLGSEQIDKLLSKTTYARYPVMLQEEINKANKVFEKKHNAENAERLLGILRRNDEKISDILENPSLTNEEEPYLKNLIDKQKNIIKEYREYGGQFTFTIKNDGFTIRRVDKSSLDGAVTRYRKMKHEVTVQFNDLKRRTEGLYIKTQTYFNTPGSIHYKRLTDIIIRLKPEFGLKKTQLAIKLGVANKDYLKYRSLEELEALEAKIRAHVSRYGY